MTGPNGDTNLLEHLLHPASVEVFGDLCVRCEERYCLPGERATCTHKALCEDCWPNGCDECEEAADAQ